MEVVVFTLAAARYAVPVASVLEVMRAVAITPMAGAPRAVEGVINLRGRVVAVVDVRGRFGLAARALDPAQHFILLRIGRRPVAVRVDEVRALQTIDAASVHAPSEAVGSVKHVAGVATLEDGLVVIYDVDAFLTQAEATELDDALDAADVVGDTGTIS